jgi:hypothetical protein
MNSYRPSVCSNCRATDTFWTSAVFERHKGSLHAIFEAYAASGDDGSAAGRVNASYVSVAEFLDMMRDMRFIDNDFTTREATLAFVWSRMRVIDELKESTRKKVEQISFEDWLEVLVRVATMKEMPTDEEIAAEGLDDPGYWLLKLQAEGRYETFAQTHSREWCDDLRQPLESCVEKLVSSAAPVSCVLPIWRRLPTPSPTPPLTNGIVFSLRPSHEHDNKTTRGPASSLYLCLAC